MSYNLILVDVGYEDRIPTIIHKMNVITGDYLLPSYLKGDIIFQARELVSIIVEDKPDKIIFDKSGIGHSFYSIFLELVREEYYLDFSVDAFGLITYSEENKLQNEGRF